MQIKNIEISPVSRTEIKRLQRLVDILKKPKDNDYFEKQFEHVEKGERTAIIATWKGQDAAYAILNKSPKYALFKKMGIPEIQDLNVLPEYRRRGIGRAMIEYGERWALENGFKVMGISVGLHSGYGAAQRLYVKMGYIPDGTGVNYDRKSIGAGEFKPIDDCLCLVLIKDLK